MHVAQPGSHVTFDSPSEGLTGSTQAKCGDMYALRISIEMAAFSIENRTNKAAISIVLETRSMFWPSSLWLHVLFQLGARLTLLLHEQVRA